MENQELSQLKSEEQRQEIAPRPDQIKPLITSEEEAGLPVAGGTQVDRPIMPINEEENEEKIAHRSSQSRNIKTPASGHAEALIIQHDQSGKFTTNLEDLIGNST